MKILMLKHFPLLICLCFFCALSCDPEANSYTVTSETDCIDFFRYKIEYPLKVDSVSFFLLYEKSLLVTDHSIIIGFYDTLHPRVKFGPHSKIGIFDTLVMKFQFACNGRWLESYDYKIRNRKDVFTHIDYKEQIEGELMFDAELDSICPGLSNYRISQYTDDECLDELKNFSK